MNNEGGRGWGGGEKKDPKRAGRPGPAWARHGVDLPREKVEPKGGEEKGGADKTKKKKGGTK